MSKYDIQYEAVNSNVKRPMRYNCLVGSNPTMKTVVQPKKVVVKPKGKKS